MDYAKLIAAAKAGIATTTNSTSYVPVSTQKSAVTSKADESDKMDALRERIKATLGKVNAMAQPESKPQPKEDKPKEKPVAKSKPVTDGKVNIDAIKQSVLSALGKDKPAEKAQPKKEAKKTEGKKTTKAKRPVVNVPKLKEQPEEVYVLDYKNGAFVVVGNTRPIKDTLKALGGLYNRNLAPFNDGSKVPGWWFNGESREVVTKTLCM
jgi:hypothetical protein